jgi:hypothetical protein
MATDMPLGDVVNPEGLTPGVLSSDVALYHIRGAMGKRDGGMARARLAQIAKQRQK